MCLSLVLKVQSDLVDGHGVSLQHLVVDNGRDAICVYLHNSKKVNRLHRTLNWPTGLLTLAKNVLSLYKLYEDAKYTD